MLKLKQKIEYCEKVIKSCKDYKQLIGANNLCVNVCDNLGYSCITKMSIAKNLHFWLKDQEKYIDRLKEIS